MMIGIATAAPPPPRGGKDMLSVLVAALRFGYLGWAAVELAAGNAVNAVALFAIFLVLLIPRALRLPIVFEVAFLVAWTLQALGQVAGLWTELPWWDTLVHTVMPAVLAPTALVLLIRYAVVPDVLLGPRPLLASVLLAFLIAAGAGAVYEIYEWISDAKFATTFQPGNSDTMTDTAANAVGGIIGGLCLVAAAHRIRPVR